MRPHIRSSTTVSRSARALRPAQDDLHIVEENVKAALMAPRNIVFPTIANTPAVLWLVALTCVPEIMLTLGESGLLGFERLRGVFLMHGAFWNGLLNGWEPVYPGQSVAMFFTHAALHGSLLHLLGNMVAVLALGGIVVARIGQKGFLLLYAVSAFAGGVGFALLSQSETPMVGASGAVFGLIGAWKFWEWQLRHHLGSPMRPLWRSLVGLAVLNIVLWLLMSGMLAWEAHLGGFVGGVLFAAIATPSLRHRV
jgi:membrane associated rhomboid family serine protease